LDNKKTWLITFAVITTVSLWLVHTFILGAAWGAIMAIMVFPLFSKVAAHHRLKVASAVAASLVILILVFMGVAAHELLNASKVLIPLWKEESKGHWPVPSFLKQVPWFHTQIIAGWDKVTTVVSNPLTHWSDKVPYFITLFKGAGGVLADIFIAIFVFFFLLKDGSDASDLCKGLNGIHPLLASTLKAGISTLRSMAWSVLMAVIGEIILFWALLAIAGIPHPFIIGMFIALVAIIPILGTVAMISVGGYLIFVSHQWVAGIIITILGLVILGLADNYGKPVLARMVDPCKDTPSLFWIIIGMLSGATTMGVIGVFIGPAILSMLAHTLAELKLMANKGNQPEEIN
jgi:predicted PurR-regulated permease PerM